jgi:DNA-binding transcriptional regulator WhiA
MWSGDKAFVQNLDQRDGAGQETHRHINSVAEIAATMGQRLPEHLRQIGRLRLAA